MPKRGIEPLRDCSHGLLRPACLPVPSPGLVLAEIEGFEPPSLTTAVFKTADLPISLYLQDYYKYAVDILFLSKKKQGGLGRPPCSQSPTTGIWNQNLPTFKRLPNDKDDSSFSMVQI